MKKISLGWLGFNNDVFRDFEHFEIEVIRSNIAKLVINKIFRQCDVRYEGVGTKYLVVDTGITRPCCLSLLGGGRCPT